jgi:hypothetical protein
LDHHCKPEEVEHMSMLYGNCNSHKSMHELFSLDNYSKGDDACAIFHHNAPPT